MELIIIITLIIALETTFLTYKSVQKKSVRLLGDSIILDTSALIDGRIMVIAETGFIGARLIIPKSVVRELQYLADKADRDKRERARYGLDVIQKLQQNENLKVEIYDDGTTHEDGVDEQLIILAKQLGAKLCTTDYNLNKVARVESIAVVNVNELAHALRPMHLPGEKLFITVVQPGQGSDQGVGYLDDGTMVVVDNAKKMIGKSIEIEAVRVLQTEAGRMLFARFASSEHARDSRNVVRPNKKPAPKNYRPRKSAEDNLVNLANN